MGCRTPSGAAIGWLLNHLSVDHDPEPCVLWPFYVNRQGYGVGQVDGRVQLVHRVVAEKSHGAPPEGSEAAHCRPDGSACESQRCVNPHHLRWATPVENAADKARHGTLNRGEGVWTSKLTAEQVLDILRRRQAGETPKEVARLYGVDRSTISRITAGRTWAHLSDNPCVGVDRLLQ